MAQFLSDSHPPVRMLLVGHFAKFEPNVAIRLVNVMLLEFF